MFKFKYWVPLYLLGWAQLYPQAWVQLYLQGWMQTAVYRSSVKVTKRKQQIPHRLLQIGTLRSADLSDALLQTGTIRSADLSAALLQTGTIRSAALSATPLCSCATAYILTKCHWIRHDNKCEIFLYKLL